MIQTSNLFDDQFGSSLSGCEDRVGGMRVWYVDLKNYSKYEKRISVTERG
ncbi:MAG: hypothetical protein ACOCSL_05045 [Thermoplasmatota archaeon]